MSAFKVLIGQCPSQLECKPSRWYQQLLPSATAIITGRIIRIHGRIRHQRTPKTNLEETDPERVNVVLHDVFLQDAQPLTRGVAIQVAMPGNIAEEVGLVVGWTKLVEADEEGVGQG